VAIVRPFSCLRMLFQIDSALSTLNDSTGRKEASQPTRSNASIYSSARQRTKHHSGEANDYVLHACGCKGQVCGASNSGLSDGRMGMKAAEVALCSLLPRLSLSNKHLGRMPAIISAFGYDAIAAFVLLLF